MGCGPIMVKKSIHWSSPPVGVLKFNVDGVAREKTGPVGIKGVLRNSKGGLFFMFSKHVVCVILMKLRC